MWVQRKNNPHGMEEGYCLSRTQKQLIWLIWALLLLVMGAALGVFLTMGLDQDRTYWDRTDYITLAVSGGGAVLMTFLGLYLSYAAVRDGFFPAKSFLAQSIGNQLPYPDEAPPIEKLFAMVDNDLKENARWFGSVGIGREWESFTLTPNCTIESNGTVFRAMNVSACEGVVTLMAELDGVPGERDMVLIKSVDHQEADYMRGFIYARGLCVPEDIKKGVEYLQKAGNFDKAKEELLHYKKTFFGKWIRRK